MEKSTLTMLGTGNATVTRCFNTCFIITTPHTRILIDGGGGNGILSQLEKAGIPITDIHHLYITHAHTDHILGCIWIVRIIAQQILKGKYEGNFQVYSHHKALHILQEICRMTLTEKLQKLFGERILFQEVTDGETWQIEDVTMTCFDIHSTKEKQFGFRMLLPDRKKLVCLGDEPYNAANEAYVQDTDWLLCEAFCLYSDRERFDPYKKHHCTARDVAMTAAGIHPKNLLVYHTEDTNLKERKKSYTAEISPVYNGNIFVPDDLETIEL